MAVESEHNNGNKMTSQGIFNTISWLRNNEMGNDKRTRVISKKGGSNCGGALQ